MLEPGKKRPGAPLKNERPLEYQAQQDWKLRWQYFAVLTTDYDANNPASGSRPCEEESGPWKRLRPLLKAVKLYRASRHTYQMLPLVAPWWEDREEAWAAQVGIESWWAEYQRSGCLPFNLESGSAAEIAFLLRMWARWNAIPLPATAPLPIHPILGGGWEVSGSEQLLPHIDAILSRNGWGWDDEELWPLNSQGFHDFCQKMALKPLLPWLGGPPLSKTEAEIKQRREELKADPYPLGIETFTLAGASEAEVLAAWREQESAADEQRRSYMLRRGGIPLARGSKTDVHLRWVAQHFVGGWTLEQIWAGRETPNMDQIEKRINVYAQNLGLVKKKIS